MTTTLRLKPAVAQGAMTPNTRLAFEQAKRNWQWQRINALLDSMLDDEEQLDLPFNTLLA
jgi:hypothetical protein